MKPSKFTTVVPTWRVFPRVFYFFRRYSDLLPRFNRVKGTFPKSFHDESSQSSISEIYDDFSKAFKVNVIGFQELEISHVLVSMKPLEREHFKELQEPARISVNICHVSLDGLDANGLEKLKEVLVYFDSTIANKKPDFYNTLFIVIDVEAHHFDEEKTKFRDDVFKIVGSLLKNEWENSDRIIFGSQGSFLGSKVSEVLESRLVDGFYKVMAYLEGFMRKTKQYNCDTIDIIHSELVVRSVQALLRDDIGIADMRKIAETEKSEETEGMSGDDKFLHQFLKKLARLVKCSIVEPFSMKHNIPPWVCNLLLAEINFETKITESVSRSTRHHLRKLSDLTKDYEAIVKTHKRKGDMGKGKHGASPHEYFIRFVSYKFDFIVYPLQNDMSKVINDAEKTMESAGRVIAVMLKMIFEVEGYLQQTITEEYEPKKQTPSIPKDLRNAILKLQDVHAIGTIYDVVEVHVNKETDNLKDELSSLMKKYEFRIPYKVKTVQQQATAMMANIQHENGKLIKSPYPGNSTKYREGTLGAFVQAKDKTLYALTCAHVVCNPNEEEHDVFIQDRGLRYKHFGACLRKLTINTGTETTPLIDIAAVRVDPDFVTHCIRHLKDDTGINRSAFIADDTESQLIGRFIYKYGAMSGLTTGITCSTDFSLFCAEGEAYTVLIESLPGAENDKFAKRGDSGAVICTPAVDSDSIKVLAMLSAGDYVLNGEDQQEKYLSFLMKTGLQKLRDRSDVLLNVA